MSDDLENFDHTHEGREMVALLQKHAPPPVDSRAGADAVLARLQARQPEGKVIPLRWLAPLIGAAAAVVITLFIIDGGNKPVQPETSPPPVARVDDDAPRGTQLDIRREQGFPEIVAYVRGTSGDGLLIDAGAKDGLRVGDKLIGANGFEARVTTIGIFEARISASGALSRGAELRAKVESDPQQRAAQFSDFGGDPGAFLEFGALFSPLPPAEARMLGLADGAALRVDEVISTLLKGETPVRTLASRLDLRADDVVVEVNGAAIGSYNDLANALGWSRDPAMLNVKVFRNGRQLDLRLR
ncbi:MAG: hypothetical protein K8I27_13930 [Planctomycetes bacterium]|nr:hypothetical protein [Planctomycetota bacterium]